MSKVKIQGNAAGTGIFTVAAPATNTDRTITLPDVDATVLTTAGGTISGVTQINHPTETGYASTAAEAISKATLRIKTHSTDSTLTSFGGVSGGDAYIQRTNGSGSSQYNLRLNPFGGAVLMPNQPSLAVSNPSFSTGSITGGTTLFDATNSYNSSNGRFTAPVTGKYLAGISVYVVENQMCEVGLFKNGSIWAWFFQKNYTGGSYEGFSGAQLVSLNAGDYITWYNNKGSIRASSDDHRWVYLIG
jgi:hypothetical protein